MKLIIISSKNRQDFNYPVYMGKAVITLNIPAKFHIPSFIEKKYKRYGIYFHKDDGWNGSYHAAEYFPATNLIGVYSLNKKAGWMGKLRKAAKELTNYFNENNPEFGKTIAIRKNLYKEGD